MKKTFFIIFLSVISLARLAAQESTTAKTFTYEGLYDNPYDISKLFIQVQPIYGEFFTTNVNAGIGFEAHYYHNDVFDLGAHFRTAYSSTFEMTRHAAEENSDMKSRPRPYNYFELVGNYHVVDREEDTETKFILYSKRYEGKKWAATVPLHTIVPTKMRRVYGVRVGGFAYTSAVDYTRVLESQGKIPREVFGFDEENQDLFDDIYGDISAQGFFLGGSLTLIKNVAIQPDRIYGTLVNDLIFNVFFDVIAAPSIALQDIQTQNNEIVPADEIETNMLGGRVGIEGRFNRSVGWAYGAEAGYRPGLKGEGFYATVKISFPVFATRLNYKVESFGK